NLSAKLIMGFASLSVPVALVWIVNGVQPFMIFIIGLILTIWIPHIIEENMTKKVLIQRVFSMCIIFIGIWILFT
ncbi:MAG: hypothetical protein WCG07_03435, partial [Candidatus Taylorbacteria bacterium]